MAKSRGAFLVFEGCDRAGKSTQVRLLLEALKTRNVPVASRCFPDRTTAVGSVIDSYLSKKDDKAALSPETIHLLFSANRWECKDEILRTLQGGTTLLVDRYAASGAAYSAATTGKDLDWCKQPDKGLPSPDAVIFLKISRDAQRTRNNWGNERFENDSIQQKVSSNFEKLQEQTWCVVDADQDPMVVHKRVLEKALTIIENVKDIPVSSLYEK